MMKGSFFFSSCGQTKKKIEVREMPPLHFCPPAPPPPSLRCLWNFHVGGVGPGFQLHGHVKGWRWLLGPGEGEGQAHNDIHEELRRQPGKECWPCCWMAWHWLMRERKKDREKIRREGWHWYSRPAWGSWTLVRGGERLRKSLRLHCWSGRG